MNTHISPAIIMRTREFGEADLLVSFFTSDKGQLKGVAKGALRSRRRFVNCLDLFCLANLEYQPKKNGSLCFLHSCKLIDAFAGLRSDFSSLSLASYMVELTEILFPLGVVDNEMFELLKNSLFALNEGKRNDILHILFEAKAMALGGYAINVDKCCNCGRPYAGEGRAVFRRSKGGIACLRCERESRFSPTLGPETVKALRHVQSGAKSKVKSLSLTDQVIDEIKPVLKLHVQYRLGQRLKAAKYLE